MNGVFNDLLFLSKFNFAQFTRVNAFNDADMYLIRRSGVNAERKCKFAGDDSWLEDDKVININPKTICKGYNVFTMNMANKDVVDYVLPFHPVTVCEEGESDVPISVGEYVEGVVYTNNDHLPSFEAAIMVKYFAISHKNVKITLSLHALVSPHFSTDKRVWFQLEAEKHVIQTKNKEVISLDTNEIINLRHLQRFYDQKALKLFV